MHNTSALCLCTMRIDMTPNICYNIITEREIKTEGLVHKMFTQYSKELNCWGIYKLVQKGGKIKAECLAAEQSSEAAIRKMHELYNERG